MPEDLKVGDKIEVYTRELDGYPNKNDIPYTAEIVGFGDRDNGIIFVDIGTKSRFAIAQWLGSDVDCFVI